MSVRNIKSATALKRQPSRSMPVGEAIIEVLRTQGVEDLYSSPGSDWPAVWEGLAKLRARKDPIPRYHNCRHETVATAMAMGSYMSTGRLPWVMLHTGVGVLNASIALRAARNAFVPMVVLAGETDSYGEDPIVDPGFQWLDQLTDVGGPVKLIEPCVKWATKVPNSLVLPDMLEQACRIAMTPPRGPVVLSISMEVTFEDIDRRRLPEHRNMVTRTRPDAGAIAQATEMLRKSSKPYIITERAGADPSNVKRLVKLAEELAIPVVETGRSCLNMPTDHPLHHGIDPQKVCKGADLIILLSTRTPWHPATAEPAPNAKIIVIDENPDHSHAPLWNYRSDLIIRSSIDTALDDLLASVRKNKISSKVRGLTKRRAEAKAVHDALQRSWANEAKAEAKRPTLEANYLNRVLGELIPADAYLVEETITTRHSVIRHIPRTLPGSFFGKFGGGLGLGLGTALGVKTSNPKKPVICVIGDGTFYYNPALPALGYMQEYDAPIMVVIHDNLSYSAMRGSLLKYYPRGWAKKTGIHYGSEIKPKTDYAALAQIYGGHGEVVSKPSQVRPAIERCLKELKKGRLVILQALMEEMKVR